MTQLIRRNIKLSGWAKNLPDRIVTNEELSRTVDTSDEWIRSRTGIGARRVAGDDESASSLGAPAALRALEMAGVRPDEVDLIICATSTPDRIFPSTASLIQARIGAGKAAAFDLGAACTGFIYAFVTACQFIRSGMYSTVVVVGAEVYSRILDWSDRSTCVLFGDGAGAVVLQATDESDGVLATSLGSDGNGADLLFVPCATGPVADQPENGHPALRMSGSDVFKFAVNVLCATVKSITASAGLDLGDVDMIISHQANERILRNAARTLELPNDRFYQDLERYGNTSAASIPIALTEAVEEERLHEGDRVVMVGFGGGLSWGGIFLQLGPRNTEIRDDRAVIGRGLVLSR